MSLIENFYDLQRYVKTCADRADLQVVWDKSDAVPRTDGKLIHIPRVDESFNDKKLLNLKYAVAHEVAHCIYTDFELAPTKGISMDSKFGLVLNMIEDHRIDYLNSMMYTGDYTLCKQVYANSYGDIDINKVPDAQLAGAIIGNLFLCVPWQPDLITVAHELYDASSSDVKAEADRFVSVCSDYVSAARDDENRSGTTIAYEATLAFLGTEEEEKAKQKAESEAAAGDGEGSGKEESGEDAEALKSAAKCMPATPDMDDKSKTRKDKTSVDKSKYDTYIPDPLSELIIEDFPARNFNQLDATDVDRHTVNFINSHLGSAGGMANKLRTKLQILSRSRTKYGTKSGKLHANALHRICIPDGGEYSERIFKRKDVALDLDVAVTVLIDMSGSMSGNKYEHAALATTLLNESLGTVLRVPLELLGFTESLQRGSTGTRWDGGYKTHMVVLKNFQNAVPKQQLVNALGACASILCENTDGEAILFAHDRLVRQRAKRKVLFVLSDGQPCGGRSKGSISSFTEHVINHIQQRSPVEIYGIGFLDDSVRDYYKEHAIIDNVSEIESKLVSVITKKVFGV